MHDSIESCGEQILEAWAVGKLALHEFNACGNQFASGVAEIVVDDDGMALLGQSASDRPTYVPSAASDQNSQPGVPPILYAKWVPASSDFI